VAPIHFTTYDNYHFGSFIPLEKTQAEHLVRIFKEPARVAGSVLGGRASVVKHTLDGIDPLVIKFYRRGGLISHFNKDTYLRLGKVRCRQEFEILDMVRSIGVRAPQPVAYAYKGTLRYQCWLVTEEIQQHQTLAELSLIDSGWAEVLLDKVIEEVSKLVRHNIYHVDLHPGNIIVDSDQNVFLIDFDKAHISKLNQKALRKRYFGRWRRAVIKHRLPDTLWYKMEQDFLRS
jgi:3-deoxy-D-manno-octulosonic acid kinase